ncbi:hypothetical protein QUF58_02135 [Anaerolineales bacterium HSG24]|nr:hypothetical protein [Anaerolineales bacterium HSG24]
MINQTMFQATCRNTISMPGRATTGMVTVNEAQVVQLSVALDIETDQLILFTLHEE